MTQYLLLGFTFAFAAAVQPGPLQSYFISQSLSKGWRKTIFAAFAPIISDGPIIVIIVILLNQAPAWLLSVLQSVGGAFLLYLAFKAYMNWKNFSFNNNAETTTPQQSLFQAVVVNFLNPAPYLGWSLIMGPLLIKAWRETPVNGITLLISFYSTIVIVSMVIIFLFSSLRNFGFRVTKALVGLSAIALSGFGFYQLWSGLNYFL